MAVLVSPQTEFGLGGVISSAATVFLHIGNCLQRCILSLRLNIRCRLRLRQGAQWPPEVISRAQLKFKNIAQHATTAGKADCTDVQE